MTGKKLINTPESLLDDALAGMAAAHPELRLLAESRVIVRAEPPRPGKVGMVSGGGSGHEPLHTGFVGPGMLDAAVPGALFTSPTPDRILAATRHADTGSGVVHLVKNYTGDILNFTMAQELAADHGHEVRQVVIADDIAVEDSTHTAGRRGTGATVFVHRLAGALAERGAGLDAVAGTAQRVADSSASLAAALTPCSRPGETAPGFRLPEDEIEFGVGIHGEPGRRREKYRPARELVGSLTDTLLDHLRPARGSAVLLLVNGLGATPLAELYVSFAEVSAALDGRGVTIARSLVGNYVTSLDMAGVSLTLCPADDETVALWDSPVRTPALRWGL
ncbi:dihydroxyacetone kinase subunit DhaK [Streptomyces sp. NPDC035033]|uniref:dihydroxyacetone kinase subunit DhaK n=1 Tax=Streptomyces sp. NPDC035033 TaxID=3155368 RepID=UPI0034010E85